MFYGFTVLLYFAFALSADYDRLERHEEMSGMKMNVIRPISDLRDNFTEISETVHETAQPVFLTKDGYGDMVVLSMESFQSMQFESEVYFKLLEAEREAEHTNKRYSSKEVLDAMREAIRG